VMQWMAASLNPPHLACIAPWGGYVDGFRHRSLHGGIPNTAMLTTSNFSTGYSDHGQPEDALLSALAHPFDDAYWADKRPDLSKITVPAYVIADWTDYFIHSPGTMDGFVGISSKQKWLEINGDKKWARMVVPEHTDRLRAFYDTFLKGIDAGLDQWPPVRLEVRDGFRIGTMYDEPEWPLSRADYRRLHLLADGTLGDRPTAKQASLAYDSETGSLSFDFPVAEALELTGFIKLRLWVEADGANDMDLFVALRRIDRTGTTVHFPLHSTLDDGDVTYGCLRVSHRTQDPVRSTEARPYLTHDRELPLSPGEIVPVDIEIWPTSTRFEPGETIRLIIQGRDIVERAVPPGHKLLRNKGRHIIHVGGDYECYLLVPVIPPRA